MKPLEDIVTIETGKIYTFTKSGNKVRAIEPAGKKLWTVERVDGASIGKRMIVVENALSCAN